MLHTEIFDESIRLNKIESDQKTGIENFMWISYI